MKKLFLNKKNCAHVLCFLIGILPLFSQGVLDTKQLPPNGYEYIAYLPEGYEQNMEEYPVLVYLHGGDGVGNIQEFENFDRFRYGVPVLINNRLGRGGRGLSKYSWDNSDLIVVVPRLPCTKFNKNGKCNQNDNLWNIDSLHNTVLHLKERFRADVNRVYFSGISLGAKGVWDYAMAHPDVPAAIVPISGNALPDDLCNIKDIPIWAFHGDIDGQVEPDGINSQGRSGTYILIDILNNCPNKKYIAYLTKMLYKAHDADGSGWDPILDLSSGYDIYEWMLRHKKGVNNNVAPVVLLNQSDQKYLWKGEPITMKFSAKAFDSNGDPLTYAWYVDTDDLGAATFLTPNTQKDVFVRFDDLGTYTINIEANDGQASNSKSIEIEFVETLNDIAVVGFELYKYDEEEEAYIFIQELQNGDKVDTDLIGTSILNIKAKLEFINGFSNNRSLIFSLSHNQNFRTTTAGGGQFSDIFLFPNSFKETLSDGEYIITATAFNNKNPARGQGISDNIVFYVNEDPPAVLPVEFLGVAAQQQAGGEIVISWATASEKNNDFFTIERAASSTDHFEPIGTEKGKGDSHTIRQYKFIDHNPLPGINFYRIKQTDFDGKADYSAVTSVYILDQFKALLYPNPANNGLAQLQLFTPDIYTQVKVQVMDALGNVLHEENRSIQDLSAHEGGYVLNMKHTLKPGLYFVNVSQGGNTEQRKFIAQ